jgi:adenosylmethionine-8-amino-7-oxononanoate aminotransferase
MDRKDEIVRLDKQYVWHPYTEMESYVRDTEPLVIREANGSRLVDEDGRSYIDANASWWTALLGHRHPRLMNVLREQSERMCHVALAGITHEPAARLAAELVRAAPPGLGHVFYSDDGSTAVEVALKQALQFWHNQGKADKRRFVALEGAFHGDTLGVVGLGGVPLFRAPFHERAWPAVHVPVPPNKVAEPAYDQALGLVRSLFKREHSSIAAMVVEPIVQGAAGMRIYAADYLAELRELCDVHDILLVFDEVFTGYGRTGPMWAAEHANVTPDMLCTAKGFCGGVLPMAATLSTDRVFDAFKGDRTRALYHGHTFCGHALGAAIAREVLAIYRDEAILEGARPKALRIGEAFAALAALPAVVGGRSLGMIGAVDLAGEVGYLGRRGWDVYARALDKGVYLRPLGNTVYVTPPLNIPDDDLDELLRVVRECIEDLGER